MYIDTLNFWACLVMCLSLLRVVSAHKLSPCVGVFDYEPQSDYETDRWYGKITLITDDELEGVWLRVTLDKPALLLLNWFGESTSADNLQFKIVNNRYILEPGPAVTIRIGIIYDESLGVGTLAPSLERITLNGRTICPARKRTNVMQSPVFVSRPTGVLNGGGGGGSSGLTSADVPSNNSSNNTGNGSSEQGVANALYNHQNFNIQPNDFSLDPSLTADLNVPQEVLASTQSTSIVFAESVSQTRPRKKPVKKADFTGSGTETPDTVGPSPSSSDGEYYKGDFTYKKRRNGASPSRTSGNRGSECGTVRKRGTPLILHGQGTIEGAWPWHVALYRSEGVQLGYICGGSLISDQFVLTAAHCVTRPQTSQPSNIRGFLIYLGSTNLRNFGTGIQVLQVARCHVHPDYNAAYLSNDMAILKLGRRADITDWVRPICLWSGEIKLESVIDTLGTVVGWGFDEHHNVTESLQEAKMPVVASDTCIYSNPDFYSTFTSHNTFCAGFRNGTTVCNGDSGGGMVFPTVSNSQTVWEIRGIVSVGLALQGENVCDPSQYIVFTDVAKYLDWIKGIISESDNS